MMTQISRFDNFAVEIRFTDGIPAADFDIILYTHDTLSVPIRATQRDGILTACRRVDDRIYIDVSPCNRLGYGRLLGRTVIHVAPIGDIHATDVVSDFETDFELADIPASADDITINTEIAIRAVAPIPNLVTRTWWVAGQDTGIALDLPTEIDGTSILPGTVTDQQLAAGSVTAPKLADGSVTADKLGEDVLEGIRYIVEQAENASTNAKNAQTTAAAASAASGEAKDAAAAAYKIADEASLAANRAEAGAEDAVNRASAAQSTAAQAQVAANDAMIQVGETSEDMVAVRETANTALTSIDELQIGGVNYINATNQGISYWEVFQGVAQGWTTAEAELLGQRGVTMSGVNGSGKLLFYYPRQSTSLGYMYSALREGDDVVVSFDAETQNIRSINMSISPATGSSAQAMVRFEDSVAMVKVDGLAHYEWRGKVTANVSLQTQIVYMHVYPREADMPMTITLANLQLERGTRSTSWTPSQVDIDNRLASVVKTTDKAVITTGMIADNAVTPEKLSTTTKEMFVRTMVPQTLTAAQQNTARNNISAMAATPSGAPMHYMYELLGATWNGETGYWEIGFVKDITAEQMRLIYLWRNDNNVPAANQKFRTPSTVRVIVNMNTSSQGSMQSMFYNCAGTELILLAATITVSPGAGLQSTFYNCQRLQEITGTIDLHLVTTTAAMTNAFYNCTSLREVRLYKLAASGLDLSATGVLSAASVRYLVENAANTTPIVVYVSPSTMSNITAGAGDWAGIAAAASAKDIRFELSGGSRTLSADDDNVLQYIEEGE